ncbi:MAG: hypothetical protein PWK00_09080, partial [Coxiella burnetii]|nr:hypothetical protein [Coxiella burnetii]
MIRCPDEESLFSLFIFGISREKMMGRSMLSHRRLNRLLRRLRAMPEERLVLVAFIIMNHTTRA